MNYDRIRAIMKSRFTLAAVAAVCVVVATADAISAVSAEELLTFWGTLVATFAGVGAAALLNVWFFFFQEKEKDKNRTGDVVHAFAGELSAVLDVLKAPPNIHVQNPANPSHWLSVVTAHLEPTATEETLRLGLLGDRAGSAFGLFQIASIMREYSRASERLINLKDKTDLQIVYLPKAYEAAEEVDRLKMNLIIWVESNIAHLKGQGVEVPDDLVYRSDPNQTKFYSPQNSD